MIQPKMRQRTGKITNIEKIRRHYEITVHAKDVGMIFCLSKKIFKEENYKVGDKMKIKSNLIPSKDEYGLFILLSKIGMKNDTEKR